MKSSRKFLTQGVLRKAAGYAGMAAALVFGLALAAGWRLSAEGRLPESVRNLEGGSAIESAFYRLMSLPGGQVLFRRAPRETRPALSQMVQAQPQTAELYSLRAMEDEQALDFPAAEADWKRYAENASDKTSAQLALADFYQRRLRPAEEIKALAVIAHAAAGPDEILTPATQQRSWLAWERIFGVIQRHGLPPEQSVAQYKGWLARYPQEQTLYTRFLEYLIGQKDYSAAGQLIADYHQQFPGDEIFPVKAQALVEYRQGSVQGGLAVYERSFQPLWSPELVKSYFDLLTQTQNLRRFLDQARAALNANPEDLNAIARVFYYYQQQGKLDAAQEVIADFRAHKEAAKAAWKGQELFVCARLLEDIHVYPEAARYYFALYNSQGMENAQEIALAGLTNLLLTAPESPIRLGTGELSMYRDIATLDPGPGYLNGILSLLLNSTEPAMQYSEEEQRAVPYFHRARAAELLALLDTRFPNSARRPELHAKLLEFYAGNGESAAVIQGGKEFLANFRNASQRTAVALLMADAYARTRKNQEEFAIYDSVLQELAAKAQNVPLGDGTVSDHAPGEPASDASEGNPDTADNESSTAPLRESQAFQVSKGATPATSGPRSAEYSRVLERYLARLVELKQVPQALAVLRQEMDRNPNDPGLYERIAKFLDQNRLGAEQEEVYRRAMAKFPDKSWYDKLARFYLRYSKKAEFEKLTEDAIRTFRGTELEQYFDNVSSGSPALYVRFNQYANQRFPHNPTFVRNLLNAYRWKETYDPAAWEALLRQHWFEDGDLRNQFFEYLSSSGKLEIELAALRKQNPAIEKSQWTDLARENPAAGEYLAQAKLWGSHFEESAPVLKALAEEYPADFARARTASSVYRSLAYFDPGKTEIAAQLEDNLLQADPGSSEILARIGDIYADRDLFTKAAPYWDRIPQTAAGQADTYLEAATIYWDYFDFDNALRLLRQGRRQLHNENLYRYEAGAIYENQRDYAQAIAEYTQGGLAEPPDSQAEARLLALARRPKFRDLTDQATAKAAAASGSGMPSLRALRLRVAVLEAQNRQPELASYLDSVVRNATSMEQAAEIENIAQQRSLETVRQHAMEKQAALTTDPVARMQLSYALVRFYEGRQDFASAQRDIEALYRDNPKILGVVRSTVDFYWRRKLYPRAIEVLLQAAKDAHPELGKQFRFEAARKSTESGQYGQARELLAGLLKDSPYDGPYLAAMAVTYAQAGDDPGLRQFYVEKIALFRNAPFSADERKTRMAALRRGLIPALTRMKDYPGAVDQYIELLNAFPEDAGLTAEAALYAQRYQRAAQLTDFYRKTVAQSPRDYRWPMVLARIQTTLEDFPAAIDTYAKAIAVRPDRTELRAARAEMEVRLLRFDDAAADYERLYQLAYKDPQWMEKVAEIRARQGKTEASVAALKTALIEGRPENPAKYFEAAQRLESWGMLPSAASLAEQGVQTAGADLLAKGEQQSGVRVYVRLLTRMRRQEKAYATLKGSLEAAGATLPVVEQQIAQQGLAGVTDREWRERVREGRIATAREGMRGALSEMGSTVAKYFTPEEKFGFAQFAAGQRAGMNGPDTEMFAIPLAQSAGLTDLEARWRYELLSGAPNDPQTFSKMYALIDLQRRRAKFAELGEQMEKFAVKVKTQQRTPVWVAAAHAYRSAGDPAGELRTLAKVALPSMGAGDQQRLLALLLARRPQELVQRGSYWDFAGQTVADFTLANGDAALAHALVAARGAKRPPVWNKSYNALAGLYFSENTPEIQNAFLGALGDATIAERLGHPVDRSEQLAGNVWFYYGARYGEYLGVLKKDGAEDYLPAELELSPGSASGYITVADYYADKGDMARAITDYQHALELTPRRPDVLDRLALAYYKQDARAEALAQWKQALVELTAQMNSARVPESFWADFGRVCDHLGTRKLFAELKPDADALLRAYLRRNGNYRSNALLHSAYSAMGDPAAATSWVSNLASAAQDPASVLADLVNMSWIPVANRAPLYQRILEAKQDAWRQSDGAQKEYAQQELRSWQTRWAQYLVQTKQYATAADFISALPRESREAETAALVPLELQAAAQLHTLDARIAAYRADPAATPGTEILRNAARQIAESGDKQSARQILEFIFAREIEEHRLNTANFLGLAEIRIAAGDMPGALELLRRLTVAVGNPLENLEPAAALLERTGHPAEAIEFLEPLAKSSPWEPEYRLRLAKAKIALGQDVTSAQDAIVAIASNADTAYGVRTQAALALHGARPADLHSKELDLLAANAPISPIAGDQPFFYEARLSAAQSSTDRKAKVALLSGAVADEPSRDEARIPLFQAAMGTADEFALGAMETWLRQGILAMPAVSEQEDIFSDAANASPAPYSVLKIAAAQQAQLAWDVGRTMIRVGRGNEALPYLQFARRMEKTPAKRKQMDTQLADVREQLRRKQINAGRQPILHEALDQDRVVRPRLVAKAAPPLKPVPAKAQGGAR
ncbi:MAG: tetratricopeptide repeat protein [Acidobacteria bacterium]|nr:tetratricopeptide repeat protein [Acidobacteriota bacterium]